MKKLWNEWFEELTLDREINANILAKPSMSGFERSVVDKYSEQAHFIYELLQNADDAGATRARFRLTKTGLAFFHNGNIAFSVSDPHNERCDKETGRLGHVNAITSIANSNKDTAASIGKYGIGFKAVFQYTQTPHIYDPFLRFKIERFIVPRLLSGDFDGRQPDETAFWLPFDHHHTCAEEAYGDIQEKLKSLVFPTLFLTCLKTIDFATDGSSGSYSQKQSRPSESRGITCQLLTLMSENNGDKISQKLWLFSRGLEDIRHSYSVGYFVGGKKLVPTHYPAFCFFPTKESTNLNFIINAPFLLTDSREGIKAGESWNNDLVQKLAELAAEALLCLKEIGVQNKSYLIDESLIDLIPYCEDVFAESGSRSRISFKPFYTEIRNLLHSEAILPAANGKYAEKSNSYWFNDRPVVELFSDRQLAKLLKRPGAKWVFTGLARNQTLSDYDKSHYLLDCVSECIDTERLLRKIDGEFICQQRVSWLHRFYAYLNEAESRAKVVKRLPIFLDDENNAVPAFDHQGQPVLFLPDEEITGYVTVKRELLKNKTTRAFCDKIGIKKPDLRDEIYTRILPEYDRGGDIDTEPHFLKFFRYFKDCPLSKADEFVSLIKDKEFVSYRFQNDEIVYRGKASEIYWPDEDLVEYFVAKPDARFLDLESYHEMISTKDHEQLHDFLRKLGVRRSPDIVIRELVFYEARELGIEIKGKQNQFFDKKIDGADEFFQCIDLHKSVLFWKQLLKLIKEHGKYEFASLLRGKYCYVYYRPHSEHFVSSEAKRLCNEPWLFTRSEGCVSASEVTVQSLAVDYDTSSSEAKALIEYLQIKDDTSHLENLTLEQRRWLENGRLLEEQGVTQEDVQDLISRKARNQAYHISETQNNHAGNETDVFENDDDRDEGETDHSPVLKDVLERLAESRSGLSSRDNSDVEESAEVDEDEYIRQPVDFARKIELEKRRSVAELARIENEKNLVDQIAVHERYSFGWFKAMLELECQGSNSEKSGSKVISIGFGKVEKEAGTDRTLILKHPDRYIPQSLEDLADIPLVLDLGGQTRKVAIEVVNVKSYTLRVKLKTNAEIDGIDLAQVREARIDVKNPTFLLEELKKQFASLDFDDDHCMHGNLPANIEFVFGPPGTGKTTYLAKDVLVPLMQQKANLKILVLTPTNKAADVLVSRIMEVMGNNRSYEKWLVRFGATNDETIEQSPVYRDKTFDIRKLPCNVTVTTIARFPYDYFIPDSNTRLHLASLHWDYIVIDEASMIPLANIIFPVYKKTPKKFIIAGDPFQIEPIAVVEDWKDENIYSFVQLNQTDSFLKPDTAPHAFAVTRLTTQYRSVPSIGEVFSRFTYNAILKHHRNEQSHRPLQIDGLQVKPLNIIKFPVSKYESIYRAKRLQAKTPYHVYSALFTFEFAKYLAGQINKNHAGESIFKIGIIAPYRAQANLIDKLIASWRQIPSGVDIQTGTIHGFQGDECDIIITVFNPPPGISPSPQMFLNKQNILNVSISRARDYLFILMPDEKTENVQHLQKVKNIEELVKASNKYSETNTALVENIIFGQCNYLEENAFSTSHQIVNVYSKPEKRYEVRSEDSAIDVQIHEII